MLKAARFRIIGLLTVLVAVGLTGCSALRLGYSNGPQLAWWWVDGMVDFSRSESPKVRVAIDQWFEWHRASQLPEYAALLAQAQQQVAEPLTGAQACQWQDRIRQGLEPALRRATEAFADVVPGLGEAQFKRMDQRNAKTNQKLRDDHLQSDPQERQRATLKRAVERTESVYGDLSEAQKQLLTSALTASPFNPEVWLAERQRRQRDTLQTLKKLVADKASKEDRVAALRGLVARIENSPEPSYRDYQARLKVFNCGLLAQLHNTATPTQRKHARDLFSGWEADLRWLIANPTPPGAGSN
jgi:Family of unknown function (DUF6279)